ncbi:MAG: polysaccharide deacetylase family protein [Actinomycetota bacterium]|nr:polysaccharide deacetylase family protein [Actinomycetota bacterium]
MTILCYHSIDERLWSSKLVVSPDRFADHCDWLARSRRVKDLTEVLSHSGDALTFDDGFGALYHHALPVLERHRLPATIFLVAETLTSKGRTVDWIDDPPDPRPVTLTLDQVLEMQERGIRFESHSRSHHDLTTLDEEECVTDLRESKEMLEQLLGKDVTLIAYPRGRHNDAVRRAAQRAGFVAAFSLPERREPVGRFSIPRVGIYQDNSARSLRVKTSPGYLKFRMSRPYPWIRRLIKGKPTPTSAPS